MGVVLMSKRELNRIDVLALDAGRLGYYNIRAVPEPSTWAMLLIGFLGIGFGV
jgi:hypothetical protein